MRSPSPYAVRESSRGEAVERESFGHRQFSDPPMHDGTWGMETLAQTALRNSQVFAA